MSRFAVHSQRQYCRHIHGWDSSLTRQSTHMSVGATCTQDTRETSPEKELVPSKVGEIDLEPEIFARFHYTPAGTLTHLAITSVRNVCDCVCVRADKESQFRSLEKYGDLETGNADPPRRANDANRRRMKMKIKMRPKVRKLPHSMVRLMHITN